MSVHTRTTAAFKKPGRHGYPFNYHYQSSVITSVTFTRLHDSVPVVPGGDAEEREERHAEGAEVRVLPEALARMVLVATCEKAEVNSFVLVVGTALSH